MLLPLKENVSRSVVQSTSFTFLGSYVSNKNIWNALLLSFAYLAYSQQNKTTRSNSIRKKQDVMKILRTSWKLLVKALPNIRLKQGQWGALRFRKPSKGNQFFIKLFWNVWSNLNEFFGRPPWKSDADEMLKKSAL